MRWGLAAAGVIAALAVAASASPDRARAAPCPAPVSSLSAGTLTIQGDPSCSISDEDFRVYCAGTVKFDYVVNGVQSIPGNDTGVACGAPTGIQVIGHGGDDDIDLSAVSPGNGFASISQNLVDGGFQNDTVVGSSFADSISGGDGRDLLDGGPGPDAIDAGAGDDILRLRDGGADNGNCGDGFDAAQADAASLDALAGCEIADRPPVTVTAGPQTKKKCKKKHGKRRHCKKRRAAT